MRVITDVRCATYRMPGHPERPERILATQARLREQRDLPVAWVEAAPADEEAIGRAHTSRHLKRLDEPRHFDDNTPYYPGIGDAARRSAGAALQALAAARDGEVAFSLMRPPGHHALAEQAMGFCYLSNAAIAALSARAAGCLRVAVYDFDVHHGNGTEDLLVDRDGLFFVSVHRSPGFPHTGLANRGTNCFNHPVAPFAARKDYRDALSRGLADLAAAQPDLVVVSAGFDAYVRDPIGKELLAVEDFFWLGEQIRALGVRACHLLEGGYSDDLPELVFAYLCGLCAG
jgi:acetoin utilization deacetylase AcuC-like enzyme